MYTYVSEVLRLRRRVRGLVVLVIYTQLSSIETDVENVTAVAYQNVLAKPSHDGQM